MFDYPGDMDLPTDTSAAGELALVSVAARGWSLSDGQAGQAGAPAPSAAALAVIELAERLKSRLDAAVLPAWRMLHAAYVEALDEPGRPPMSARDREWETSVARSGAVDEVMAATGLGEAECRRRLGFALAEPTRVEALGELLGAGALALWQVLALHDDTADLDPAVADAVVRSVTAPTRDGQFPAHALRRRRLRRELTRHGAGSAAVPSASVTRRDARAEVHPDGSGCLRVTGESGRVVAAMERVDRLARGIRASGRCPDRTLAQLRSDVTLDLLLRGAPAPADAASDAVFDGVSDGDAGIDWSTLGESPAATVQIVVPLDVLTGAADGLAELPGHGWVRAEHARQLAHAPGSVWQRLVTDPLSGALVELSSPRYQPPPRLRAHVVARDQVCRAPGCQVPAARCDLDHDMPWPAGDTAPDNLTAKHRRHHQLKTTGLWRSEHDPLTHEVRWMTVAGRSYTTSPHDFRELLTPRPQGGSGPPPF